MFDYYNLIDSFLDNIKKVFYPEEWMSLDLKFSKSELFSMMLIDRKKEITMSELAEYINAPMSTATGVVDRLVKNKYLKRERSESDRRIVVIRLTDEGEKLVSELKATLSKYIEKIFESLTEEEKQLLIKVFFKVMNVFEAGEDTKEDQEQKGNIIKINID